MKVAGLLAALTGASVAYAQHGGPPGAFGGFGGFEGLAGRPGGPPVQHGPPTTTKSTTTTTKSSVSSSSTSTPISSSSSTSTPITSSSTASTTTLTTSTSASLSAASSTAAGNSSVASNSTLSTSADAKANPGLANSALHRGNWLTGYDINTDTDSSWPSTGNTVSYTLTVENVTLSPQGDAKQMLAINGQFPGPTIEANWGDTIQVTIINNLKDNGTDIHWHGMRMLNTNHMDGVGGVTECPIAPGQQKTYTFQATTYGSTWYHSHFSVQAGAGVAGPLVIHGPASANYDIDLGPVLLGEYYDITAFQALSLDASSPSGGPKANNYLINGKNIKVDGSAGSRTTFSFTPGKKHLLRLINGGVDGMTKFQIDGHSLTVIAADMVPITPYVTNELSIAVGQRYDVVVTADQPVANYWLRAMAATDCSQNDNVGTGIANAIVNYSGASNSSLPNSTYSTHSNTCVDEAAASLVPVVAKSVDSSGFASSIGSLPADYKLQSQPVTVYEWYITGLPSKVDPGTPSIAQSILGNNSYGSAENVIILNTTNAWQYYVVQNAHDSPHPIHIHGHDFYVLGQGSGTFSASTMASSLNFATAPRRDTANLPASGWLVIAFKSDNPGLWLLHCHIAWHVAEGMALQFLEQPANVPGLYKSYVQGSDFQNTCAGWNSYVAAGTAYRSVDSGLKRRNYRDVTRHAQHVHAHAHGHKH